MEKIKSYKGLLDGKLTVICGIKPDNMQVQKEYNILRADEGKVLKKGEEIFDSIILEEGDSESNYVEVEAPKIEEPEILEEVESTNS